MFGEPHVRRVIRLQQHVELPRIQVAYVRAKYHNRLAGYGGGVVAQQRD